MRVLTDKTGAARRGWVFLALALAWGWGFWIAAARVGGLWFEPVTMLLVLIGGAGLPGAAMVLLFTAEDNAARRAFWLQALDPRKLGGGALAMILLLPPGLGLAAGGLFWVIEGDWPVFVAIHVYRVDPGALGLFLALSLVFVALPQELGWRGYALPRLQAAYPVVAAVLIVGVAQALWYVPLFLIPAAPVPGSGLDTPEFWRFLAGVPALAVVISWVYNASGGSVVAATAMHFTAIAGSRIVQLPQSADLYRTALLIAFALLLIAATRGNLGLRPTQYRQV